MTREVAEGIAIAALTFIAADHELLQRFMGLTGYTADNIRRAASQPDFLTGVMQHIVDSEPVLLEFASAERIRPEEVAKAAQALGVALGD